MESPTVRYSFCDMMKNRLYYCGKSAPQSGAKTHHNVIPVKALRPVTAAPQELTVGQDSRLRRMAGNRDKGTVAFYLLNPKFPQWQIM